METRKTVHSESELLTEPAQVWVRASEFDPWIDCHRWTSEYATGELERKFKIQLFYKLFKPTMHSTYTAVLAAFWSPEDVLDVTISLPERSLDESLDSVSVQSSSPGVHLIPFGIFIWLNELSILLSRREWQRCQASDSALQSKIEESADLNRRTINSEDAGSRVLNVRAENYIVSPWFFFMAVT